MSETTDTANAGEQAAEDQQQSTESENKTFTEDQVNDIVQKRLARERAKFADYDELKTKASQFDQLADSKKSETQKLQEQIDALNVSLKQKDLETARLRVVQKYSIPDEAVKFLQGEDSDSLEESGKELQKLLKSQKKLVIPSEGKQPNVPDKSGDWLRNQFFRK